MESTDIRDLEGWLTVPEAAERLSTGRANLHKMIKTGKFAPKDLRKAGPVLLVRGSAVDRMEEERRTARAERAVI